nr:glycosyltransferase family 2 protein [Sphingomonas formosensis]
MRPTVSVVVPFLNEVDTLAALYGQIAAVLEGECVSYEVVFVNDGSTDGSEAVCRALATEHAEVVLINFRRNFGKSAALSAGFREARGEIIVTMDADLQDDPAELPRFLAAIRDGADVVCGWKKIRNDPPLKVWPSRLFNAVVNRSFGLELSDHNCGFKAYRAEALANLNLYGELHRFVPALLQSRGFRIRELAVQHHPRRFGNSKFGTGRLVKGALDLLTVMLTTRFATRPLHIFGTVGLLMLTAGMLSLSYLVLLWLMGMGPIGNRPLLFFGILLMLFGGQLISTGLIAELVLARSIDEKAKYDIRDRVRRIDGPIEKIRIAA